MSLHRIFEARSVAVIGASRDEKKRGYQAVRALIEGKFDGPVYPVHPKENRVLGLRCYPSVMDIDYEVDVALVTTPAATLPAILEQCGRKGVAGAVVIAGGFGEMGKKGKRLQESLVSIASRHDMRILGPNTSGMINVNTGLNLVGISDVPKGDIALIAQSGNMALHLITEARIKSQKGFSCYVGVGNEADIKFHEFLEYFSGDPATNAIIIYVEGMRDGRRFLQEAHKTCFHKPVVLLKSGRSAKGSKSAGSHTGALAGISEVARSAFERAGIITIDNSDELFPAAEALSSLPPISNRKVAILADGGGHATIAADVLTDYGIDIPPLGKETRRKLKDLLMPNSTLHNPVDVAGSTDADPGVFADCAEILLGDKHIGGLLIVGLFGGYGIRFAERLRFIEEDAAHRMGKLVRKTGKPIVVHSLYKFAKPHSHELLRYYGIPVNDSVDVSCKCIDVLSRYGRHLTGLRKVSNFVFHWRKNARPAGRRIIDGVRTERRSALLEYEAKQLLKLHGAPVTDDQLATSPAEAAAIAVKLGTPVALKVCSPDILHKSDGGGVKLKLANNTQVRRGFAEIMESVRRYKPDADIRGCIVSPMARPGTEVIVGTKIDPQFGPVIMFGIGGILVEVVKDVVFRVLPISRPAAKSMLGEIRSAAILSGVRGEPPVDREALVDLLMTVSDLVESYPEIREMDLNPVIAHEKGLTVVDARVIL